MRARMLLGSLLLVGGSTLAQTHASQLSLEVAGGMPGSQSITIELLDSGCFRASGSGMRSPDLAVHKHIGKASSDHIFALARDSANEWRESDAPAGLVDCKWAVLRIIDNAKVMRVPSGCLSEAWYSSPKIKQFLKSLDQFLPPGWTASEVSDAE
jgi:hypothetical protein